jgi:hypothetical protein
MAFLSETIISILRFSMLLRFLVAIWESLRVKALDLFTLTAVMQLEHSWPSGIGDMSLEPHGK